MPESCEQFIKRKNQQFLKELKSGLTIGMKDIGRKGKHFFLREAWTFMPQYNLEEKVFLIERLRKMKVNGVAVHVKAAQTGEIEYRIGYYMLGKNGHVKDKWTWGQFCPIIPHKDFEKLFEKGRKEGVILER